FFFQGGKNALATFGDLANQLTALSQEAGTLESQVFSFVAKGKGNDMVATLTSARNTLQAIDDDSNELGSLSSAFVETGNDWYLPLKAQLGSVSNMLDTFIPWFSDPTPHHILVLFQNPSEMRPAGGFLGSYADVTLAGGDIKNIAIH